MENKRLGYEDRIACIADAGSFSEINKGLAPLNVMEFAGYDEKLRGLQAEYGINDAVVTGVCAIAGHKVCVCVMDSRFLMGSMGCVVGEKIARAFEYAQNAGLPLIIFSASGGARMQEGIFSLMQMAKTAGAAGRFSKAGGLYISVVTDPTSGGVTASFAMLGDVIIAEAGAMVGFAGQRVIQGTIGADLPADFQTGEFLQQHGFIDMVCARDDLRGRLATILKLHEAHGDGFSAGEVANHHAASAPGAANSRVNSKTLTVQERLAFLRGLSRPGFADYLPFLFEDWTELSGDRCFGDDPSIMCGIASLCGQPVTVIAQLRARNIEEFKKINYSMPHPEGYRKAMRVAEQAEKFGRPVLCFIDTPGAFCGVGAEERGQGEAIASSLRQFMGLQTPVVSVVLGFGGSGGALAIGVCDELAMLENSLFFVISPRGFASILWKDPSREAEAITVMKGSAEDLVEFGVCDEIIPESWLSDAEKPALDVETTAESIQNYLVGALNRLKAMPSEQLVEKRYEKFRAMGRWEE